ncbi:MAG: AAA family ATPase [Nitrospira sp.]|nr:AAA family ATPase [Nitrospira sp.]
MRIQRLDLLRYGRFTDTHLALPVSDSDFHIVFGPNEAGKSTALSAIEDLLFGIASNSPYNFLHDYGSMRIGAVLENGEKTLEVRRRKGNKDTLLTANEVPVTGGAGALAPFLAGADHAFFTRMFSLDHERLRKGGREILEAQDEVGQMLFSAGAGLSGLRDRLKALTEEADSLWGSRRAAHRKYYQVLERFDSAEKALREHTVTGSKWQEVKRAYDDAQDAYANLEKQNEDISREQRKLSRIRRVYRDIRKIATLDEEIKALGKVIPLPEDAAATLDAAEREYLGAETRVETLKEQLETEVKQREALQCSEDILIRQDDIEQFHKHRIEVQKEKTDLPNRLAELASAETNLQRVAGELEWKADDVDTLVKRIPLRAKITVLRSLLTSRGERLSAISNAKVAVDELEGQIADVEQELAHMGEPIDVSKLAAVLKATRESGDVALRVEASESEIRGAKAAIERRLKCLNPLINDVQTLASTTIPTHNTIHNHRDDRRDADQRIQACRERIRAAEQELARHRKAHERLARDEDAVAPKDLVDARELRDSGWSLIRRQFVEGVCVPDDEIRAFTGSETGLPKTYETAVTAADALADRRFDNAQAAAQIAMTVRQIAEQEELLDGLRKEEGVLSDEIRALESAWKEMWAESSFEPLSPDSMLEWLASRNEILETVARREAADRQLEALREEEFKSKARILGEMEVVSGKPSGLDDEPLRIVMEAAADVQSRHVQDAADRRQSEERLRKMKLDAVRKATALKSAEAEWTNWQTEWDAAVKLLGLAVGTRPEAATAQLDALDQMREIAVKIHELRHERIEKIERDIEVFGKSVAALVAIVASDLVKLSPEDAVLELEHRLETAKRIHEQQKNKDKDILRLKKTIDEREVSGKEAQETIQYLLKIAGAKDINELKGAIHKSDKLRELISERSRVMEAIVKEGDGLSLAELKTECDAMDIDHVSAREQTLDQDLKELRRRLTEAAEHRTQTRSAFDAIGGDDRAAEAAAARQSALAEMRDVAEHYVRVRSAATLLQWAIERYRRERQAPLLKRAGQVFATLTDGSFTGLQVEFDEQDRAQLVGLRPNGGLVRVGGMSTGTADQLYLALRVASVEDYLNRAEALPFVADDLFINFDNERAAAGFKVLGQLARKTQILFFTHHRHLVEIAQATLGQSVAVVSLLQEPVASAG